MHNWNDYRADTLKNVGKLGELVPETLKGTGALMKAGAKTGHLDTKTRELIALACAVTTRCDGCISIHAEAAMKAGVTEEEIAEALGVAISLNAGGAVVYSGRVLDAFHQVQTK
ncbi:carboxymuconolactone decarboxylase family protein [Dryocola clanedunensis]|uniref:carboxymuconolactone decarboxylase family protein n=1 Tax=Cedecea sulfonylureivorans TaxID=3051154 RepID=UPI001927A46A|nr:carboxymuconolactone decarboxylase family protein [Cedecea sulfonylureivorans]